MKDRLFFFGTSDFSTPALEALISAGFNIVAVITKADKPAGRGQKIIEPVAKGIAKKHGIKVLQPLKFKDIREELAGLNPDAGVVVAYGKIIPQSIIDLFPKGLINTHASLLPKYRGPAPIEAAILNGDKETGITLMQIDAGMDTGPAYVADKIFLAGTETRPMLYEILSKLGAKMLVKHLPDILSGQLKPQPQTEAGMSVVNMISKEDAQINWSQPSQQIERKIRAHLGWPGSKTKIGNVEVTITSSHVIARSKATKQSRSPRFVRDDDGNLIVHCIQDDLIIDTLKPAGKKEMTGKAFLAGHQL